MYYSSRQRRRTQKRRTRCRSIQASGSKIDDHQGTVDVEVFLHAKKLPDEINGKKPLKIASVFQVSPFFKTGELIRKFYVKQISIGKGSTIQFGLYTKGPFTPLPAKKPSKYRIVKLTGDHNKILVSNTVGNNKLYLKIRKEQVVVAPKYNKKSYFTLRKWKGNWYSFMVNYLPGHALRYDENMQEVVVSVYDESNSSFHFHLIPQKRKTQSYEFVY